MSQKCTHNQSWFCKTCSKTVLTVYWLNKWSEENQKYKPTYYLSDLAEDKKSKEAGIAKLKSRILERNAGKYQSWAIFDNQTKETIDSHGKV